MFKNFFKSVPKAGYHPIHACNDGIMNLYGGKTMNLLEPQQESIDIVNIAGALSKNCRFAGQVSTFYSVAQHSVMVAFLAPPHLKKEALMHDASEAWLNDLAKPVKVLVGDSYVTLENIAMAAISKKFNLDEDKLKQIKVYDMRALEIEAAWLQRDEKIPIPGPQHFARCWEPAVAEMVFLEWAERYVL